MPEDVLKRVLHSLACGKYRVLKKVSDPEAKEDGGEKEKGAGEKGQKGVNVTDTYAFNEAFNCPMRKIRIPMALLEESHNPKRGTSMIQCISDHVDHVTYPLLSHRTISSGGGSVYRHRGCHRAHHEGQTHPVPPATGSRGKGSIHNIRSCC
jgi:hypothetical protein